HAGDFRIAMGRGEHHSYRGGVEQQDKPKLEKAQVVAPHTNAGCLSTASRDRAGLRSPRERARSAIDSIPDQTSVAIATCKPLKNAASVNALPTPTATWSSIKDAAAT